MLTYPGAKLALLGQQTQPRMRAHDIICFHTMVGYLTSTDGYFRAGNGPGFDGTESHFGNGGIWGPDLGGGMDGRIFQWQDLTYTADANLDGNGVVISIENADNAVRPIAPLTAKQIASNIELAAWLCRKETHAGCPSDWDCHQVGIPAVAVPDTKPGRRGISWHAKGIPPQLVPGGVRWSNAVGKDCPTPVRIAQVQDLIIPGVQRKLAGVAPTQEDNDMQPTDLNAAASAGQLDPFFTRMRQVLAAQGMAREIDVRTARDSIQAAVAGVKADTTVQGDDEANLLAELAKIEAKLDALVPTNPTGSTA